MGEPSDWTPVPGKKVSKVASGEGGAKTSANGPSDSQIKSVGLALPLPPLRAFISPLVQGRTDTINAGQRSGHSAAIRESLPSFLAPLRELPDVMSATLLDSLTPSLLVRIWK